jgi:hypothetical protein
LLAAAVTELLHGPPPPQLSSSPPEHQKHAAASAASADHPPSRTHDTTRQNNRTKQMRMEHPLPQFACAIGDGDQGAQSQSQCHSPASSALRSAIPTSCAPAAGAIALITHGSGWAKSIDRLLAPATPSAVLARPSRIAARLRARNRNGRDERAVHRARGV